MKIAFMHYHLKTGGVTTVLKKQLDAVAHQHDTLVLTGLLPETPFPADCVHIPELGYSSEYKRTFNPQDVACTILDAVRSKFNGPCDVLHVHNPTLAKNKFFLKILKSLQKKGINLFLQIHDFAEDGRPAAYFFEDYPRNCHYGVINSRDYEILIKAGLKRKGLHRIENTIDQSGVRPAGEASAVLYPIRAIRRKNIGEAVLLSLLFKSEQPLEITLPPNSPDDIKSYEGWKSFVNDQKLNVNFEKGLTNDFRKLIRSASFLITTSITEGFGFSFLEPWIYGKLLLGRKLPDICRDFESNGVRLKHLYSGLYVPVDWIDLQQFKKTWVASVLKASSLFGLNFDKSRIHSAFDHITHDGSIDFGLLNEFSQKKAILKLVSSKKNSKTLIRLNPFLSNLDGVDDKDGLISNNQAAVRRNYNHAIYHQKLEDIYRRTSNTSVEHTIDKRVLAAEFLKLKEFSLLKWSDYVE